MCLETLDEKPTVKEGIGWKVFDKSCSDGGNLISIFQYCKQPVNKWLKSSQTFLKTETFPFKIYESGFHLYKTRKEARESDWREKTIKKVKFKNVVATGTQYGQRVIVAREIYILSEKVY